MKAIVLEKPGDVPHSLRLVHDRPVPEPGPGDVRVTVKAAGEQQQQPSISQIRSLAFHPSFSHHRGGFVLLFV